MLQLLTKLRRYLLSQSNSPSKVIVPRSQHTISRKNISHHALKVLYRLHHAGYQAYLVGGGVRDLLLGGHPKDFDAVTDARPEQVAHLFRNCRLIGRRFRLAHIHFGNEIIEVATFRGPAEKPRKSPAAVSEKHNHQHNNIYGSIHEDVWRRDFTINALYYNIADFSIVDYTQGLADLKEGIVRMIGDPVLRYHEDPVRILRAVRLAAKLNFKLHAETEKPIYELSGLIKNINSSRLYEEMLKILLGGHSLAGYHLMRHYGLLAELFPQTEALMTPPDEEIIDALLCEACAETDRRVAQQLPLNPAYLLAVLLWWPVKIQTQKYQDHGMNLYPALYLAMESVLANQLKLLVIPRRIIGMIREIWLLQYRLHQRRGKQAYRSFYHRRFKAAYDFLLLREKIGEPVQSLTDWWKKFIEADSEERQHLIKLFEREKK